MKGVLTVRQLTDANGTRSDLDWNQIDWPRVEQTVRRLQQRIFMAKVRGDLRRMESLQRLLASSWSAKLLAVRKVAQENDGRKTPGIDGVVGISAEDRMGLLKDGLSLVGYRPLPVRRVLIPKTNGKLRPLGIPTLKDRAMQCLVKLALEPEWEAVFEPNSFGFRPPGVRFTTLSSRSSTAWEPKVPAAPTGEHDAAGSWTPTSKASSTRLTTPPSYRESRSFAVRPRAG